MHCPLINFKRFEIGYPKEVGLKQVDELRIQLLDLSASIMGDINLCRTSSPSTQETSTLSQLPGATVSTSQTPVPKPSLVERPEVAVLTSQIPVAPTSLAKVALPPSSSENAKSSA
jgi:hypothetical protein